MRMNDNDNVAGTVLLDLDGTLTDPFPGISRSILHALAEMDEPPLDEEALRGWIGPPLIDSFHTLFGDAARAARGVALYRERFAETGLFENAVFDGIPAALETLKASGFALVLATSKPRVFATRIVGHFGLDACLDAVHGAELDGTRSDKAELIAHAIVSEGIDPRRAVMVGDRRHDIDGARANGVRAIGVAWGYGTAGELATAAPDRIVEAVADLPPIVAEVLATAASETGPG